MRKRKKWSWLLTSVAAANASVKVFSGDLLSQISPSVYIRWAQDWSSNQVPQNPGSFSSIFPLSLLLTVTLECWLIGAGIACGHTTMPQREKGACTPSASLSEWREPFPEALRSPGKSHDQTWGKCPCLTQSLIEETRPSRSSLGQYDSAGTGVCPSWNAGRVQTRAKSCVSKEESEKNEDQVGMNLVCYGEDD